MNFASPVSQLPEPVAAVTGVPSLRAARPGWLTALGAALLFILGGVAGSGATVMYWQWEMASYTRDPRGMQKRITDRVSADLGLNAEETARVAAVVQRHEEQMSAIRKEMRPKMEAIFKQYEDDVLAVLSNEDQRAKFRERQTKFKASWMPSRGGDGKRKGDRRDQNGPAAPAAAPAGAKNPVET